ncbi:nucleoside deaminase [Amycolatopsis sp. WAC 04197]|uniref:nucleoside deaminase n=1 Tax=Amycolatopsis sp. WAC 04197 TaxID=2203199 RepID=UPI001F1707A0|nr:nucleoside deaminase [Amycolatopsis sp. WAC 04197]
MAEDHEWLVESVKIAARNVAVGGGPFGAMIVKGGEVVATGVNQVTSLYDPTAHAEVVAIRQACWKFQEFKLAGCVLVSSCEPCPMCLASALWARVDRVVYAADRHDAAMAGFDDLAFYELFEKPRDTWEVPVRALRVDNKRLPFKAWAGKADRIDY